MGLLPTARKLTKEVKSGGFTEASRVRGSGGSEVVGLVFAVGLVYCMVSIISFEGMKVGKYI